MEQKRLAQLYQAAMTEESTDVIEVMELERPYMYDYLMRMTGQIARAEETIEEIYRVVAPQAPNYQTWEAFRVLIYTTLRNFNLDAWNAETNSLENSGLKKITDMDMMFSKIDQYIRLLPGQHRETFICIFIYKFSPEDLSRIVRREAGIIRVDAEAILKDLSDRSGQKQDALKTRLSSFPLHLPKGSQSNNTVALSQVVGNMEEVEKSDRRNRFAKITMWFVLILAVIVSAYFFGVLDDYLEGFSR